MIPRECFDGEQLHVQCMNNELLFEKDGTQNGIIMLCLNKPNFVIVVMWWMLKRKKKKKMA